MRKVYWIPECEGIHGVHQSGGDVYEKISPRDRSRRGGSEKAEEASQSTTNMKYDIPFEIEQGGIQVIRPLLAFSKRRLIATCKQYETPWAEDPTNQDRTLTQRNAIRYMFANNVLPQPLSSSSLVQVANRMQARVNARKAFAEDLFNRIPLKLDIQTNSLVVRLPSADQLLERPIISSDDRAEAADNGHCLLFRIADLVTPKSRPSLSAVAGLVSQLWPELEASEDTDSPKTNCPKSFTAYGVWWQPWDGTNLFGKSTYERDWLLSRPPLTPREEQLSDVNIVFPPKSDSKEQTIGPRWRLFDNRYWIQVHNKTDQELVLRCMTITEQEALSLKSISKASRAGVFRKSQYYHIYGVMSSIKPASLRRSLPVLFTRSPDGIELPFLLPTLNLDISDQRMKSSRDICDWSIRYKKIDLGQRDVSGVVMPVKKQNKHLSSAARLEAKKQASWKQGRNTKRTGKESQQRTANAPYPQSRHTVRLLEKELLEGITNATPSSRVNVAERGALKIGDTSTIESESSTDQHKEDAASVNGGKTRPQTPERDSTDV
jgi:tRNA(Ile)-lysidine synthase